MKKDVNVDRYEKDLMNLIENLRLVIQQKDLKLAENTIEDIKDLMELYRDAMQNRLSYPRDDGDIHEDSGLNPSDLRRVG